MDGKFKMSNFLLKMSMNNAIDVSPFFCIIMFYIQIMLKTWSNRVYLRNFYFTIRSDYLRLPLAVVF